VLITQRHAFIQRMTMRLPGHHALLLVALLKSVVAQDNVKAPSKAIHNRPD
jgi:hypothetical protein